MKTLFLVTMFVFSGSIFANQEGDSREKRVPPPEAISACKGKSDQTVCTMKNREGEEMTGLCEDTSDGKYFACKPPRRDDQKRPHKK